MICGKENCDDVSSTWSDFAVKLQTLAALESHQSVKLKKLLETHKSEMELSNGGNFSICVCMHVYVYMYALAIVIIHV